MPDQTPSFDDTTIADVAMDLYGIEGAISPLVSFEDQNAHIKTVNGSFVLKFANKRWDINGLHMQTEVYERLGKALPHLSFPRIIPTNQGETVAFTDGFATRLLTFIEGDIFSDATKSPELYHDLGCFLGLFTKAMQGYAHAASRRYDDFWNLDNVMVCKAFLSDVTGEETRVRIQGFYQRYEQRVLPILPTLRKAVIHNDANEQNILTATNGSAKVVGLIDFADLSHASLINELAIALAYTLLGEKDVHRASSEVIRGFTSEFPLFDQELSILFDLIAMRLIQSITLSSRRYKEFAENDYILVSQNPARALLKKLEKDSD